MCLILWLDYFLRVSGYYTHRLLYVVISSWNKGIQNLCTLERVQMCLWVFTESRIKAGILSWGLRRTFGWLHCYFLTHFLTAHKHEKQLSALRMLSLLQKPNDKPLKSVHSLTWLSRWGLSVNQQPQLHTHCVPTHPVTDMWVYSRRRISRNVIYVTLAACFLS